MCLIAWSVPMNMCKNSSGATDTGQQPVEERWRHLPPPKEKQWM